VAGHPPRGLRELIDRPLRTTRVDRRQLLRTAALGVLAPLAAACQTRPVSSDVRPRGTRVAYGDDPSQFAELSLPSGTPHGTVVVIHGGFWKATYDLSLGRPLATSLADHGWTAWNIEYRRVGNGGGVPQTLDDVAAAVDALADQAVPHDRVIALGHSAGGHLATWAASRGRFGQWSTKVDLTGVVSQAGVLDLWAAYTAELGGGAVQAFLGHPPGPTDSNVDPLHQIPLDVPVRCVHGIGDDIVPIGQSRAYVRGATSAGADATLTEIQGDHFTVIDPDTDSWQQTLTILEGL
jgi:acetyl esterase/lipase